MENKAVSTETEKAEQQPQTGGQSQKEGSFRLSQKLTITFLILLLVCTFVFAALVVTCLYTKRRLRDDLEHRLAKGAEQLASGRWITIIAMMILLLLPVHLQAG